MLDEMYWCQRDLTKDCMTLWTIYWQVKLTFYSEAQLFSNKKIIILGFGICTDLDKNIY